MPTPLELLNTLVLRRLGTDATALSTWKAARAINHPMIRTARQ